MHAVLDERRPGRFVLSLHGELDLGTEPVYAEAVEDLLGHDQVSELFIDLAGLEFMDSTGIRALLRTRKELTERGVPLRVGHPNDQVLQLLRVAAVDQLLDIIRDGPGAEPGTEPG